MITGRINKFKIILASNSPRRQQLLREAGINFEVAVLDYDESFPPGLTGSETAMYVAKQKASFFRNKVKAGEIVITADTIVWCNNKVLGKPSDARAAIDILNEISGNSHEVITAVVILSGDRETSFYESTKVTFESMTDEEISYYVENFKPFDKAGAYGIQEWIGIIGCSRLEGSYFNVVGLPVHRLYTELGKFVESL